MTGSFREALAAARVRAATPHAARPVRPFGQLADASDKAVERAAAVALSDAFGWEFRETSSYSPVDWHAYDDDRLVRVVEIKGRQVALDDHPTTLLRVVKWDALMLASAETGVPPMLVVVFTDCMRWIEVGPGQVYLAWRGPRYRRAGRDRPDPTIEIPIGQLQELPR